MRKNNILEVVVMIGKAIGCVGAVIMFFVVIGLVGNIETHYTREAKVVSVSNGVATFECSCGYLWDWELENGESFRKGDDVTLVMHTNYTDNTITDDVIEKIER